MGDCATGRSPSGVAIFVVETEPLAESPLEFWIRVQQHDGAWLRSLAARMADAGALGSLLRVGCPPAGARRPVSFDLEARTKGGGGATVLVRWDAGHGRFRGELDVVAAGPSASRLGFSAVYEASWTRPVDRATLQVMADEAGRAFLHRLAAGAASPVVPVPAGFGAVSGPSGRRRVLIEDEDPAWPDRIGQLCERDYEFTSCRGPLLTEGGCPLLRGEACPKLEWADTVVHSLDRRQPANAALWGRLKWTWPDGSLVAVEGRSPTHCISRR